LQHVARELGTSSPTEIVTDRTILNGILKKFPERTDTAIKSIWTAIKADLVARNIIENYDRYDVLIDFNIPGLKPN
jgi:hypothetical protein